MQNNNISSLTSIRGIAALVVLFYHIHTTYNELYFFNLFKNGSLGVDLFFVLSGFIMAYVYKNKFLCNESFGLFYKKFITSRLARIYPLHLVTLMSILLLVVFYSGFYERYDKYLTIEAFLLNIFLVQNWGLTDISWNIVSWSISAEFFMYLLFPFMLLISKKYKVIDEYAFFIILVLITLQLTTSYVLGWKGFGGMSLGGMVRVIFEFSIGFIAFTLKEQYQKLIFNKFKNFSILLGLIIISSFYIDELWVIFIPTVTMLILHLSIDKCSVSALLSKKFFVTLGNISFSLYMWHWMIIQIQNLAKSKGFITIDSHLDMYISCITMSLISLLVAYLSYNFIEKPARKHSKRLLLNKVSLTRYSDKDEIKITLRR